MGVTFSLVCHATRQKIWIGQTGAGGLEPRPDRPGFPDARDAPMSCLYYGEPATMERLRRFLNATKGKPLVFIENDTEGNDGVEEYEEFEEFEETPEDRDGIDNPDTKHGPPAAGP